MRHGNKANKSILVISYATGHVLALVSILSACTLPSTTPTPLPIVTLIQRDPAETSTPFLTATPRPTATASPTSTPDVIATLSSEFEISGLCLFSYLLSNDENWIAADCRISKELIIVNQASKTKNIVRYQDIVDEAQDGLVLHPLSWSKDNKYLYFTTRCCHYDDALNKTGSLYQYDIEKTIWSKIVRAVYEPYYFFSADGDRIIFLNHHPLESSGYPEHLEIGMIEVSSNKSKRLVLKYYWGPLYEAPHYAWSNQSDLFGIVLDHVIAFHPHTIDTKAVLLRIDFKHWEMELLEDFDSTNLLGIN